MDLLGQPTNFLDIRYSFVHGKPQCSFLVFTYALTASGGDSSPGR